MGPRIRQVITAVLTLALLGGIGVGVYFGVTLLLAEEEPTTSEVSQNAETAQSDGTSAATEVQAAQESAAETSTATDTSGAVDAQAGEESQVATDVQTESEPSPPEGQTQQSAQPQEAIPVSAIEPSVAEGQVTPAQIGGAEIVAQRLTAEAIPSGIPRTLADGVAYDPTEPATAFTSRWPIGTTLRLTRLPGATLLTDEEQAEIVGAEVLVVVRATESSNTDLQLSPAAFDQIAVYGTERIIAVRVEVTAPPP